MTDYDGNWGGKLMVRKGLWVKCTRVSPGMHNCDRNGFHSLYASNRLNSVKIMTKVKMADQKRFVFTEFSLRNEPITDGITFKVIYQQFLVSRDISLPLGALQF